MIFPDYIDSVLSSELVEDEFSFLLDILRGTHSPKAAGNAQILDPCENIGFNFKHVHDLLQHFSTYEELIAEDILHELQEGPNDDEIQTMITNFIEAKFAEACKS